MIETRPQNTVAVGIDPRNLKLVTSSVAAFSASGYNIVTDTSSCLNR
jgi:hypothetical protein